MGVEDKKKYPPNLYRRGDSWVVDFRYRGYRYTENIGPVSKTIAKEKRDALKGDAAAGRLDLGTSKIKDLAFPVALDKYLQWYKANRRPASHGRHVHAGKHLSKFFGQRRLSTISTFLIESYKRKRKEAGAAEATVNRELALLKNLYNKCIEWGFARKSPARGVKTYKENNARTRYLDEAERPKLLEACDPDLRFVVLAAMHTGMRSSELKSLTWSRVDLRNRSVTVDSAYSKNGESRTIPLNAVLTKELSRLKIDRRPEPGDAVFLNRDGKPWRSWRTAFENALKAAHIEDFRFHDLRHCFGSYLAMANVNEKARMELMGHKRPEMTMRYTHLSLDYKRQAVAQLEKLGSEVTTDFTTAGSEQEGKAPQVVEIAIR